MVQAQKQFQMRRNVKMNQREVAQIDIEAIKPNPYQPRRVFLKSALDELSASIRQYGLLQPISVRRSATDPQTGKQSYELIAGERRLRACKQAGYSHIDAIIFSMYEQDSAVIAMMENLQRENLHYMEEAEGYQSLIREHGLSQEELARRLGKNQSTIANKMRILRLPVAVKRLLVAHRLTERHARALLRLHDEEMQIKLIWVVVNDNLNVKATEDLVEKTLFEMYDQPHQNSEGIKRRKITPFVRDSKLYINSINSIVEQMNGAGLNTKLVKTETDSNIELHLVIQRIAT